MASRDDIAALEKQLESLTEDFKLLDAVVGSTEQQEKQIVAALKSVVGEIEKVERELEKAEHEIERESEARRRATEALVKGTAQSGGGNIISGFIGALLRPIQTLSNVIAPFVSALNPTVMQVFNQALRDLHATVGTALLPVIDVLTSGVRQLAITLYPAMQALAPIIADVANVLVAQLIPVIGFVADLFTALSPAIQFVTSVLSAMADVQKVLLTVWRSVFQALAEFLASFFGGVNLKDAAKAVRETLQEVAKYLVVFAVQLARAIGAMGFIDALTKNIKALLEQGDRAKAAPQNVGIKGFEQIAQDAAVAAFAAQAGGNGTKDTKEFLRDILKEIERAGNRGESLRDFLNRKLDDLEKMWQKWIRNLPGELANGVRLAIFGPR